MTQKNWLRQQAGRVRRAVVRPEAETASATPAPAGNGGSRDHDLLREHPLFDEEWYRLVTGASGDRAALVEHYLGTPVEERVGAHPLFDPAWFREHYTGDLAGRDPFLAMLRAKRPRTPFHPLVSLGRYRREATGVAEHPHGPLGHLSAQAPGSEVGPNAWWPGEQGPLDAWLRARTRGHAERLAASAAPLVSRRACEKEAARALPATPASTASVDVVLAPGAEFEHLRASLESLTAQTHRSWRVLAAARDWGFDVADALDDLLPPGTWQLVDVPAGHRPSLDPEVVAAGTGEWITFLDAGDLWHPERLTRLLARAVDDELDVLADVMERTTTTGARRLARNGSAAGELTRNDRIARGRLLVSRAAWRGRALPQLRTDLHSGHEFALVRALATPAGVPVHPFIGSTRDETVREATRRVPLPLRPVFDHGAVRAWDDVVLRERHVDDAAESVRARSADVVSVIVPTYADTHMTLRAVEAVMETTEDLRTERRVAVQVVVVDNGCRPDQAAVLDTLAVRYAEVDVLHLDANLGFALGNDLAVPLLRGATTVFLNNDTEVAPGWLEPLLAALEDETVLGAQPLLTYPDGSIQCAGIAFPSTGGVPHGFLQWHPVEDAAGLENLRFHAVTAACLAMRTADVVALHGFDPVYANGMEDVDLCLRAASLRPDDSGRGRFVVRPEARVLHKESVSPGRFRRYATNRKVFLDRWHGRLPADDVELAEAMGFQHRGHVVSGVSGRERSVAVPRPVLRRPYLAVDEQTPRLRWALKNPAPAGPYGDRWGDTHFADSLAEALRDAGQEVVVDRRDAWERRTSGMDDVTLLLRGIGAHHPAPDAVNLAWVISHPDAVSGAEARSYDRVFAASVAWSAEQSRRWGFEVEAMLQATDRRRFHPDLAVPDTGHPVLFVGSSRKQERPLVRDAVDANLLLSVYGTEWEGIVPRRFVKDTYLDNRRVGAAYRSAGVVLNDHWEDMRTSGFLSNRLFDAAASGARVVTDDVAGLGEIFGRSVQVARDAEDLVRLSTLADPDEVFGDDAERRAVAARVHAEHSFAARARRLVEVAVAAHRERGFDRFR